MFALPLREANGLDLDAYTTTPGLEAAVAPLRADAAYGQAVAALGERYLLGEGESLLHGDFFPGSFLQTAAGVRVIDPEFCFCGDAELDLGVSPPTCCWPANPPPGRKAFSRSTVPRAARFRPPWRGSTPGWKSCAG